MMHASSRCQNTQLCKPFSDVRSRIYITQYTEISFPGGSYPPRARTNRAGRPPSGLQCSSRTQAGLSTPS
eukprot:772156-Rhodomonas_salina.2